MSWLDRWRTPRAAPQPAPPAQAPHAEPAEEPDDPNRCAKRWMGKRCVLQVGHAGICRWQ